jgi:hypothetical protein
MSTAAPTPKRFFLLLPVEIANQDAILAHEQLRRFVLEVEMADLLHQRDLVPSRRMVGIQHAKVCAVGQRLGIHAARPVGPASNAKVPKFVRAQTLEGDGTYREADLRCQFERVKGELAVRNAHHAPQLEGVRFPLLRVLAKRQEQTIYPFVIFLASSSYAARNILANVAAV